MLEYSYALVHFSVTNLISLMVVRKKKKIQKMSIYQWYYFYYFSIRRLNRVKKKVYTFLFLAAPIYFNILNFSCDSEIHQLKN